MKKITYKSEAELSRDVLAYFKFYRIFAWRMPISPVIHRKGSGVDVKTFWKKNPIKGFPDYCGILRRKHKGVLFAIEAKSKTGTPRKEQLEWISSIQLAGGKAAIIYSIAELHSLMIQWGEVIE
jgi:hypothetical protein